MPHLKCVGCKTRLPSAAAQADPLEDLCPECGFLLEPVGALAEIVGFRSIRQRDSTADASRPPRDQRIVGRVDDLFARRDASLAQARLDAERWVDDGGSFQPRGGGRGDSSADTS
jgi:hypothetical protein